MSSGAPPAGLGPRPVTIIFESIATCRNSLDIARAPPGRLGATPWAAPEGPGRHEDNKSLENNAGSGSRSRP